MLRTFGFKWAIFNMTLEIPVSEQGPGMGGAMLAMVACGEYETVLQVCEKLCNVQSIVEPEAALVAKYETKYQKWRQIYPTCKELFRTLK